MSAALYVVGEPQNPSPKEEILNQAARLSTLFSRECGFSPLPYMRREFVRYLVQGYAVDMLEEVISRTARAPRPSFAYLSAIMRNAYGRFTLRDFLAYDKRAYDRDQASIAFDNMLDSLPDAELDALLAMVPDHKEVSNHA